MKPRYWYWVILSFSIALVNCLFLPIHKNNIPPISRAELGHRLFFDQRLSATRSRSCSSCHDPAFAFSDGYRKSVGVYGDQVLRNSPALINVKERHAFTWADPSLVTLTEQMRKPMFGIAPPELGISGHEAMILQWLEEDTFYQQGFRMAFPNEEKPLQLDNIRACIASYMEGLNSMESPYDLFISGRDTTRMSQQAKRGLQLFRSERLGCGNCHGGVNLDEPASGGYYANTGLYFCNDLYPREDWGLFVYSRDSADIGKFRIPSLRNVAMTAPYFHDGSAGSLREVIDIYNRGGRLNIQGSCQGDGARSPYRDKRLHRFALSENEKTDLIHFLNALTDTSYISNPYFRDPFSMK